MIRHIIQILGPVTTIAGTLLSMLGTFLLTYWYHAFEPREFFGSVLGALWFGLTGRQSKAVEEARIAADLGEVNPEVKAKSLMGIYLIFLGFGLQLLGACFWGADAVWGILHPDSPCRAL